MVDNSLENLSFRRMDEIIIRPSLGGNRAKNILTQHKNSFSNPDVNKAFVGLGGCDNV